MSNILLTLLILLYFLPTFIAIYLKRSVLLIFIINALLGWTILGWVALLAKIYEGPLKRCNTCGTRIYASAKLCRYCGHNQ